MKPIKTRKHIIQIVCTPLCKDIIEYKSTQTDISQSAIGSEIISKFFKEQNNIPNGFWEWRKNKNGL